MRIASTTKSHIRDLWSRIEPDIGCARYLEHAAQSLVETLAAEFEESVVLTRVFVTVPFDALPPSNRRFVRHLTDGTGETDGVRTATPVLSLIGTYGQEPSWSDRRQSRDHIGIPLISSTFVAAIPMLARLLKELGLPLGWVDSDDSEIIEKTMERGAGLFFVEDARHAIDRQGDKIISSDDFVNLYHVRSVFGVAESYVNGQVVVLLVFCRDDLTRAMAEHFLELTSLFRASTSSLVASGRVFEGL